MTDLRFRPVDPVEAVIGRLSFFRRSYYQAKTDFEADLCEWFGLNAGQARLLAILYEAQGPLRPETIQCSADVKWWTLRKYVPVIREALGEGAIPRRDEDETYQLTQLGRAACDEAVEHVGMGRLRKELVG